MDNPSITNWLKLNLLLDRAQSSLQELFLKSWKAKFGQEWEANSPTLILDPKSLQGLPSEIYEAIQKANVSMWDLTILKSVLSAKNMFSLSTEQVKKITQVVTVRNKIVHFPKKVVPEKQFNELWNELNQILIFFGVPDSDLQQLKQGHRLGGVEVLSSEVAINEVSCAEAAKLKEKGNEQFKKGDYCAAIQLFSQGIDLPGLRINDCATLYSNRCTAYLMLYHSKPDKNLLHKGKEDAKKAIELRPEWWRGHFRLGKIYAAADNFQKAELSFNKALAREPQSQETMDALSDTRRRYGQHSRMDYFDAGNTATSSMEYLRRYKETTGLTLDVEKLMKMLTLKSDDPYSENLRNCLLGCNYRSGLDGFPRNAQLAAKHYKLAADGGAADGMYNLGNMLLNGEGVEKDFAEAMLLIRNAAAQPPVLPSGVVNCGVAEAEHELGLCYENGIGVNKNLIEAMHWYERASNHGCSNAANNLGLMYANGVMNKKPDLVKAEQLYKSAIKRRWGLKPHSNAMVNLAFLYESKGDYEKSLKWCRRAKENGNIHPQSDQLMTILKEHMQHFDNSGVVEWEKQNNKGSDGLTLREREERCLAATIPGFSLAAESFKLLADKLYDAGSEKFGKILSETKFDSGKLERCAAYSVYGRKLWKARIHFSAALYLMLNEIKDHENVALDVYENFIEHLSTGMKIESIVMEFSQDWHEQAFSIVTRLLKRKTAFDRNVRVCYATLQGFYSLELAAQFLSISLKLYPEDCCFLRFRACTYAFLERYEDALRDINLAVKLDPNNYELLHDKAAMMKQLVPSVSRTATIDAYKDFFAHAPEDHRKYPDGYYSIACLEEDLDEVKRNFELGLAAEQKQLSFFLPYQSNYKPLAEFKLSLSEASTKTSKTELSLTSELQPPDYKPKVQPLISDFRLKISDPNRIALIKSHRAFVNQYKKCVSSEQFSFAKSTVQPPKVQTAPQSLSDLDPTFLEDMDPHKDHVYTGCVLAVTIIDEPAFTGSSIALVLEDVNGDVERCCIYNSPHMENESKAREVFGPGCKMSIINPYFRLAADGMSLIRVDDPSSLVMEGCIPSICRYCTKPEAQNQCSRCKNALYCDKSCQTLDWKTLKHKLVCVG